jgi:hypothetical protein
MKGSNLRCPHTYESGSRVRLGELDSGARLGNIYIYICTQGGAKRTHVFQIIVTVTTESFFLKKKTARPQKRDTQRSTAARLLNWSLCTILRWSGEVADLHSPYYYPFKKHEFFLAPPCTYNPQKSGLWHSTHWRVWHIGTRAQPGSLTRLACVWAPLVMT